MRLKCGNLGYKETKSNYGKIEFMRLKRRKLGYNSLNQSQV